MAEGATAPQANNPPPPVQAKEKEKDTPGTGNIFKASSHQIFPSLINTCLTTIMFSLLLLAPLDKL
jgi:hypothetical protein